MLAFDFAIQKNYQAFEGTDLIAGLKFNAVNGLLTAVIFSNKAKCSIKATVLPLCIAVFILNGLVSIISKVHQINDTFYPVSSTVFVMYSGIAKFLSSSVTLLFCKEKLSVHQIVGIACCFAGTLLFLITFIGGTRHGFFKKQPPL